jgi:histidinol-phosphate aminotransferase
MTTESRYRQVKMQKKFVRIASAVLDMGPFEIENSGFREDESDSSAIRLNRNESMTGPSPTVISLLKDFLDKRSLSRFPDPDASGLKNKIADYTGLPAEFIGCYPGNDASLEYISRTFLESGTEMLISGPVPPGKQVAARSTGASVREVFHDSPFSPGIEPIINNIGKRTRIIYIGNPSDYIGSFLTEAELIFLLAYAEHTMMVVDESYFEFSGFTVADMVKKFPNLAVVRSFSHAFGLAALKAGYVITDPENLRYIKRLSAGNGVEAISQVTAEAVLDDIDYMREYVNTVDRSKRLISSNLPEIGYDFYIAPANFIVLRVSDPASACEYMKNNGVYVKDLSDIRQLDGYLRITVGTPEQTDRLLLLLSRMAEKFATGFNRNRIVKSLTGYDKRELTAVDGK